MKNHFFRFTVLAMTCLAALSIGAADKPYVVTIQQGKISGEKLAASPSGDLTLTLSGGASQTFRAGSYRGAWIPKPPEVARLEEYAAKAQEDAILKEAPAVFNLYRFLGWGGRVSCLEGMAQYNRKQYAVALQTLDRGIGAKDDSATADLFRGKILVLLALKKNPDAAALTDKLVLATDERAAAFAFNTRGRLLQEEGKKKEAVLQYLKTLLIFKPEGAARKERLDAKQALVALLKELGDVRAQEFEKLP